MQISRGQTYTDLDLNAAKSDMRNTIVGRSGTHAYSVSKLHTQKLQIFHNLPTKSPVKRCWLHSKEYSRNSSIYRNY